MKWTPSMGSTSLVHVVGRGIGPAKDFYGMPGRGRLWRLDNRHFRLFDRDKIFDRQAARRYRIGTRIVAQGEAEAADTAAESELLGIFPRA